MTALLMATVGKLLASIWLGRIVWRRIRAERAETINETWLKGGTWR